MVTVQLIAKSTSLERGKVVLQADAQGMPHMRAAGPWLPLRPPAAVRPAPRSPCPQGQTGGAEGVHGPPSGLHIGPILPSSGLVAEPWATSALGSPSPSYAPFNTFIAILHGETFLLPPAPQSNASELFGEHSSWIIHSKVFSSGKILSSCLLSVSEHSEQKGRNML